MIVGVHVCFALDHSGNHPSVLPLHTMPTFKLKLMFQKKSGIRDIVKHILKQKDQNNEPSNPRPPALSTFVPFVPPPSPNLQKILKHIPNIILFCPYPQFP